MKKLLFVLAVLIASSSAFAQNLQLHYDLNKDRKYFTTTFEMFKLDEYGSTFTFVDFDYNFNGNKSISTAYWEIARYVTIPGAKGLSGTLQFNDGILRDTSEVKFNPTYRLGTVWLAGVSYPINLGFVTLNTDLLYRKDYNSQGSDMQLTTVWYVPFFENKVTFTGFMDIWSQKLVYKSKREFVLLTEPQLWYNIDKHLSVGTEVEISNNFIPGQNSVLVCPTVAAKWNF